MSNTYSDQSRACFLSPLKVFGYQDNSLCRLNENRSPTGEIAEKPDLNGSSNVKGYELFGGTRIENESPIPLLNCDLAGGQLHRRRRIEQFWSSLLWDAESFTGFDHLVWSSRSILCRAASLSGVAAPRLNHSFHTPELC